MLTLTDNGQPATGVSAAPPAAAPPDPESGPDFSDELLGIDPVRLLKIVDDLCTRCGEIRTAMGITADPSTGRPIAGSWAWWRSIARSEYGGEYVWRQLAGLGGGFEARGGNLSLGVSNRFVRILASKHAENLVGTDPFLAVMPATPENPEDAALSKQIEEKTQWEISRSNLQPVLAESIRVALNEGDVPIKLGWVTEKTLRPETRPVAVYVASGADVEVGPPEGGPAESAPVDPQDAGSPMPDKPKPIRTPRGQHIYPGDDTVLTLHDEETDAYEGIHPAGADVPEGKHVKLRLKKEPEFVFDPQTMLDTRDPYNPHPVFSQVPGLMVEDVQRDCLMAAALPFEDFLYDIYAPTLDDSDVQCHVYDEDLDDVLAAYGVAEDPTDRYTAMLQSLGSDIPRSAQSAPKHDQGESRISAGSSVRRKVHLHEAYYRVRVNPGDRWPTWLFLVVDLDRKIPLHAEYLANMRMKKPPFRILRGLETEPGRAYGVGLNKKFHTRQLAIDFWFNQAKLKTAKEDSADFYYPDAIQSMQDGQPFRLGTTTLYPLKSDSTLEHPYGPDHPPVFRANLHETNDKEWDLIEKLIQTGQLEFGIADIGQLQDEGAAIAKDATATATRNVERTGNTVQRSTEYFMTRDITAICEMATEIILANADLSQSRFAPDGTLLAGLDRDEIGALDRDVRLLLTKARSAESLATNQQVIQTIQEYYGMPKSLQVKVRDAFINILKSLDVQDPDEVLDEPTPEDIQAEASAPPPDAHPPETVSIKMGDLLPSEAVQALGKIGINADPSRAAAPAAPAGQPAAAPAAPGAEPAPSAPPAGPVAGQPPGAIAQHTAIDPTHTAPFALPAA